VAKLTFRIPPEASPQSFVLSFAAGCADITAVLTVLAMLAAIVAAACFLRTLWLVELLRRDHRRWRK